MHTIAVILLGFGALIVQTAVATLISVHPFAPNMMLPFAIFLGISAEVHIVRGAFICFVLGYLLDAFCGSPMGLQTFILVASFMVARGARLRLVPQGAGFQILLTFAMALLSGGVLLALRAIFDRRAPFITDDTQRNAQSLVEYAISTALFAPPIFWAIRRIGSWLLARPEDKAVG